MNFSNWDKPIIDSISYLSAKEKNITSEELKRLNLEKIWSIPSQSEMKNGGSYGCMDGYSLIIEMNSIKKYKYLFFMCPDLHTSKDSTFRIADSFSKEIDKIFYGN